MDWSSGFTAKYYVAVLDTNTWRETDTFQITGGSIKRNDTDLRESADINFANRRVINADYHDDNDFIFDNSMERWIRVYLDAKQEDGAAHVPLFTGLASAPNTSITGLRYTNAIKCYSVLKPLDDILLPLGWNVVEGSDGPDIIRSLLTATPAPVIVARESKLLTQTIIAESGETNLSMLDKILTAIKWRLRITGEGIIFVLPEATSTNGKTFNHLDNDVVEMNINIENNWYDCPNVFRARNDEFMAIARDEDPNSIYSIPARGREIWAEETDVSLAEDEEMAAYAERRLKELQKVNYVLDYTRRFDPEVYVTDLVDIHYPTQRINGTFQVISQTIDLGYGAKVSEEAKRWVLT